MDIVFPSLPASNFSTDHIEKAASLFEALVLTDHSVNIDNWQSQFHMSFPRLKYIIALHNYVVMVTEKRHIAT